MRGGLTQRRPHATASVRTLSCTQYGILQYTCSTIQPKHSTVHTVPHHTPTSHSHLCVQVALDLICVGIGTAIGTGTEVPGLPGPEFTEGRAAQRYRTYWYLPRSYDTLLYSTSTPTRFLLHSAHDEKRKENGLDLVKSSLRSTGSSFCDQVGYSTEEGN